MTLTVETSETAEQPVFTERVNARLAGAVGWLTVEHVAYGLILLTAVVMRLVGLNRLPLSPAEAEEALAVWRFWQPGRLVAAPGSPAYFSLTSLLSQVAGFSDFTMRLLPALSGIGLVALPWLLRDRVGRGGALVTAFLLAISPIHNLAGRAASGQSMAIFAGLLLFACWLRYQESGRSTWLYTMAAAVAFGLTSHAIFYSALLCLILAWVVQAVIGPPPFEDASRMRRPDLTEARRAVFIGLAVLLASGTLFLWNLGGFGAAARLLADWLALFVTPVDAHTWLSPIMALGRYELVALLMGGAAVMWATWNGRPLPTFLVYWVVAALILLLVQRGYMANLLVLTVPAYLLLGYFVNEMMDGDRIRTVGPVVGLILLGGGVFYFNLVRFARLAAFPESTTKTYHALLAVIGVVFIVTVLAFVWSWDRQVAQQSAVGGLLLLLVLYMWGTGWWVNQYAANDTRERWVTEAADDDLPYLIRTINQSAEQATNSTRDLKIISTIDSPLLGWYLRNFRNLELGGALPRTAGSQALITRLEDEPSLENDYIGVDYGYLRINTPHELEASRALQWWLFRDSMIPINKERLIFWLRADLVRID
jgi:hypothetical protein